jgi:F0F1-type ATP synthase assembly protein I
MTDRRPDDAWSGLGTGWAIVSTLIAGMLSLGLVGWLIDKLVGTEHVFLAIGIVLGGASGVYIVYLRYGRDDP